MSDKTSSIRWTPNEYHLVFKQIDLFKEIYNTFPNYRSEKDLQFIQSKLDKNRVRSSVNTQFIYKLQIRYSSYRSSLNKFSEQPKEEIPEKVVEVIEDEASTITEEQKLSDLSVERFNTLLDSKFMNLFISVSSLFKEETVSVNTTKPNAETSLDVKPDFVKKVDLVEKAEPFKITASNQVIPETNNSEDIPRLFTSDEIRKIIRQEIESIFGPISNEKETSNKTEVVKKQESTSPTLTDKPDVKKKTPLPQKKKIFIFGLNTSQLEKIQNSFENILVRGSSTLNQSAKDVAKNSDLVLVSRFSTHAGLETLKSVCYPVKVEFISGGLSMISRRIDDYIKD